MALVIDIECIGIDWTKLEADYQQYLIERTVKKGVTDEEAEDATIKELALSPFTGQIVSIALLDSVTKKGAVYYTAEQEVDEEVDGIRYRTGDEPSILNQFFKVAEKYDTFVTFAGRVYDLPFIMVRSAVNEIRPPIDLMTSRYLSQQRSSGIFHIDLMDQFSNYGSMMRIGGLHMACKAFGIETPKEEGVDGSQVSNLFAAKEFRTIADYNVRDVLATNELYGKWRQFMQF